MGIIVIKTPAAFSDSMDDELNALYSTYSLKLAEIRILRSNTGRGMRLFFKGVIGLALILISNRIAKRVAQQSLF